MKKVLSILLILIFTNQAIASNMGNGPGMIKTWVFGGLIALLISMFYATEQDPKNKEKSSFNTGKFAGTLIASLMAVFILGLLVAFGEFL